ncbi:helix-turn-helix transcriptional regulator [Liquorilactobacillus hordei]|uniref:helix-turn-helix transcriptional regulator n=1 Tax=Liquorilactobacillus hordei TaxID=468911 RepID=UPI0039EC76C7
MKVAVDLKFIEELRNKKGFTYAEMAKELGLKGTDKYYRREKGEYKFQATELPILARKLNVPIEKIFAYNLPKSQDKITS